MEFIKNEIGMCRFDFTNKKYHNKNTNGTSMIFGFSSYDETAHCMHSFFKDEKKCFPYLKITNKKLCIKPDNCKKIEQTMLVKMFMHDFSQTKVSFNWKRFMPRSN